LPWPPPHRATACSSPARSSARSCWRPAS